jgi:hypothetical protein
MEVVSKGSNQYFAHGRYAELDHESVLLLWILASCSGDKLLNIILTA